MSGTQRLTEPEFWTALEFRVSRELAEVPENHLRFLWCDGFLPDEVVHEGVTAWICGKAYIEGGSGHDLYDFRLRIGPGKREADAMDWGSLLPDEARTGWLSIDTERKLLEIDTIPAET